MMGKDPVFENYARNAGLALMFFIGLAAFAFGAVGLGVAFELRTPMPPWWIAAASVSLLIGMVMLLAVRRVVRRRVRVVISPTGFVMFSGLVVALFGLIAFIVLGTTPSERAAWLLPLFTGLMAVGAILEWTLTRWGYPLFVPRDRVPETSSHG